MKPVNPYPETIGFNKQRECWQEGFDAAIKWLFEKCKDHPLGNSTYIVAMYPIHRYLCSQCMAELKEIQHGKVNEFNRVQIKERIAELLTGEITVWGEKSPIEVAEAILNLRRICPDCGDKGIVYPKNGLANDPDDCPTCKGTGKGNRMIGILAKDQTPPKSNLGTRIFGQPNDGYKEGMEDMRRKMIKDGWRKIEMEAK